MIPNIAKGTGITGAIRYVMGQGNDPETGKRLELVPGETSRAEILGGQNFLFEIDSADRLDAARRMMEWNARPDNQASRDLKCTKDAFHASLAWEPGQNPSKEEMIAAARGFLKHLGMESAQAVFVAHHDTDHKHLHIVASRINPETGKTYSQQDDRIKAQAWALTWEREHGQIPQNEHRKALHRIVNAIEARDGAAIVASLTERTPTFTGRELDKALSYGLADKQERANFRAEILAQHNVIGLREKAEGPVMRYTTREVLASERALQRDAQQLADDHSHGLSDGRIAATAAQFTLKPEQAEALARLTGAEGFAMLWGEAGTGKSHTLKAARAAYEAEGAHVIGLAWTHSVVKQMRGDGFANANTIAGELKQIERGRTAWNKNTVVVVDEAAMIATAPLAELAATARAAGAKLILAGDDKQLASIERGGMFETLRQAHGAAILKDVQRVTDAEQKEAFGKMHEGAFLDSLKTFDAKGGLHWSDKQLDALRDMAVKYTADVAAAPDKRRFMFAFSNAEVDGLNDYARAIHKRRGDLGEDRELQTASGAKDFATGDRVQFSGNGKTKKEQHAGLTNGNVGTITAIEIKEGQKPRVTVQLDTATGEKPQSVTFTVGDHAEAGEFNRFKRGFAGTIYKGQGKTLDQAYVCHSAAWKSSAAYVALTRHRESVHIFASRETVRGMERPGERAGFDQAAQQATLDPAAFAAAEKAQDLATMARGMGRSENRRAASAYRIDADSVARANFGQAAQEVTETRTSAAVRAPTVSVSPSPEKQPRQGKGGAGRQAFTGKAAGARAAGRAVEGIARAAGNLLGGIASLFEGLLGGGPTPEQVQEAKEAAQGPQAAPSRHEDQIDAFLAQERQQHAALQALARVHGPDIRDDFARIEETAKNRDRGGGQSL